MKGVFGSIIGEFIIYTIVPFFNFFILLFKSVFFKYTALTRVVLFPKKLSLNQRTILIEQSSFYQTLCVKDQVYFEHRIYHFIKKFKFHSRHQDLIITDTHKVLIANTAISLTFGLHRYLLKGFDTIIIYPSTYFSRINQQEHKGETNPKFKTIVLSWKHFVEGNEDSNDNLNLGYHEFTHALQFSFKLNKLSYSAYNFNLNFKRILKQLKNPKTREQLLNSGYFREYAFENQFEFLAVIVENFFESPEKFSEKFPTVYKYLKEMLNVNY